MAWSESLYQMQLIFSSLFRLFSHFSLYSESFQVKHCEFYTDDSDSGYKNRGLASLNNKTNNSPVINPLHRLSFRLDW